MPAERKNLLHEPLIWFLLAGALIFLANEWLTGLTDQSFLIEISAGQVQSLKDKWQMQMGRGVLPLAIRDLRLALRLPEGDEVE